MSKIFGSGFKEVEREAKRQEERKASLGKALFRLFIPAGDDSGAEIRFLHNEPITFNEHTLKRQDKYVNRLCTKEDCPLCKEGDRPFFKGAYLVWDMRPYEYTDKDGKKVKGKGALRLYVAGARVLLQLKQHAKKNPLTDYTYTLYRTGKGTDTSYFFQREDRVSEFTEEEITNMLPEKLREDYDGTEDSLYHIIEEQLKMTLPNNDSATSVEDEEVDEDSEVLGADALGDYEEDEDEEEAPARSKPRSIKSRFKSRKK